MNCKVGAFYRMCHGSQERHHRQTGSARFNAECGCHNCCSHDDDADAISLFEGKKQDVVPACSSSIENMK
jgi:hypothetical protein